MINKISAMNGLSTQQAGLITNKIPRFLKVIFLGEIHEQFKEMAVLENITF